MNYLNAKIEYTRFNIDFNEIMEKQFQNNQEVKLVSVTGFDWDELYIFDPYIDEKGIQTEVGAKWTTSQSFWTYLFFGYETDLYNDGLKKAVFTKNKKVICDINYNVNLFDFDAFHYTNKEAVFQIRTDIHGNQKSYYLKKRVGE